MTGVSSIVAKLDRLRYIADRVPTSRNSVAALGSPGSKALGCCRLRETGHTSRVGPLFSSARCSVLVEVGGLSAIAYRPFVLATYRRSAADWWTRVLTWPIAVERTLVLQTILQT